MSRPELDSTALSCKLLESDKPMLRFVIITLLFFSMRLEAREEGFSPLFNGKDLSGWVEVNTAPSTWSFNEKGYLVCSGKPIGEIRTERMYQNFILELEWRHLVPRGNAGIFVWADDITARGQPFIRGIEVQVLENAYGDTKSHTCHGDIFPIHGATMNPIGQNRGQRAFPSEKRSYPSPQWNHYRIECQDGNISLAVNGKLVTQGQDCSPRKGYICLESEGGVVHYRNVRIKELPNNPVSPEHVAIADRGFRSYYTGVDLLGWLPTTGWSAEDWKLVASQDALPIISETSFKGRHEFIVDVVTPDSKNPPVLSLYGKDIPLDLEHGFLAKPGKWNRIKAHWEAGQLIVTLNDQPWRIITTPASEYPIRLVPAGQSTWANIYARPLN